MAPLSLSGCRSSESPVEPLPSASFVLATGDHLVYDGWIIDFWGFAVDSTKTRRTWDILSTTTFGGGYSDAIMVREEILRISTNTTAVDTFFLRVIPEGAVLRYGFLADLALRRESRVIPRRWDTLAILDARLWKVGTLDSAGQMEVTASVPAEEDYFNVNVNSVSSIFSARRVDMENDRLQYAFWISTTPPCFPRLEEEPDPFNQINAGSLLVLREARLAPR